MTTAAPTPLKISAGRLRYIDNLRWAMIFLVLSMHAADTYSPFGSWYFREHMPLNWSGRLFFAIWQMYLQSFFMGLLFFIAGYFVPASFDRKGPVRFVKDRAFRLGLPVLFYMFVLGPVTEYYVAHSWNSTLPTSMANEWIKHIRNGEFLQENGPLWFCLALLIFSCLYAALGKGVNKETPMPGSLKIAGFAVVMSLASFAVRVARAPSVLNMHLTDFPQYIFLFAVGILAARRGWLDKLSRKLAMGWAGVVLPFGFALWFEVVSASGMLEPQGHRHFTALETLLFCVWESFTCVAISLGLLVLFRDLWNRQGRVSKFLSENAFSVYAFHPPIVILGAKLLHPLAWNPIASFAALTMLAVVATYALSELAFRRIPVLKEIL
jgi:fucose 4-O-acetylase-like acetyltransferase